MEKCTNPNSPNSGEEQEWGRETVSDDSALGSAEKWTRMGKNDEEMWEL